MTTEAARMNLFCLPPGGCSATIYTPFKRQAAAQINVLALDYPGHGARAREPLQDDPEMLARDVLDAIEQAEPLPFALFGHSLGAALLWQVLALLESRPAIERLKLLVVSSRPPRLFMNLPAKHNWSDQAIIDELSKYNATAPELLDNPQAREFFLRIMRNDFRLSHNIPVDPIGKTPKGRAVALLAVYGEQDPNIRDPEAMHHWRGHSERWLGCYPLPGDHFYFRRQASLEALLGIVQDAMLTPRCNDICM